MCYKYCSNRTSHDELNSIQLKKVHNNLQNDQQPGIHHQHEEQETIENRPAARKCSEHALVSSSKLVSSQNPSNDSSNPSDSPTASRQVYGVVNLEHGAVWINRYGQVEELDSSERILMGI